MRRLDLFVLAFVASSAITFIVFILLGESRPDVYVSMTILLYYIFYSILDPVGERGGRPATLLNLTLFMIFSIIVAYRVYEILFPGGWP